MSSPYSGSSSEIVESSKSSSPSLGKVCIVSRFPKNSFYYALFIVDLESPLVDVDGFVPSAPTILFDLDYPNKYYTVCLLKSTLYFFEHSQYGLPRLGSAYTYDLSSHLSLSRSTTSSTVEVVDKTMLRPLPKMLSPKLFPYAAPTPDGNRIVVFTSHIYCNPFEGVDPLDNDIEFELYTPPVEPNIKTRKNKPWKRLPSLQDYLKKIGAPIAQFYVLSYMFITNSVFVIQIKFGIFTLDIDLPVWKKYEDPICLDFFNAIEGGRLWLTDEGAYDISNGLGHKFDPSKISKFPNMSSFGPVFEFVERPSVSMCTIYDRNRNVFGIVQVQMALHEQTSIAYMVLDVCRFDLAKYRNNKKNLESNLFKSFKFVINGEMLYDTDILYLSPFS